MRQPRFGGVRRSHQWRPSPTGAWQPMGHPHQGWPVSSPLPVCQHHTLRVAAAEVAATDLANARHVVAAVIADRARLPVCLAALRRTTLAIPAAVPGTAPCTVGVRSTVARAGNEVAKAAPSIDASGPGTARLAILAALGQAVAGEAVMVLATQAAATLAIIFTVFTGRLAAPWAGRRSAVRASLLLVDERTGIRADHRVGVGVGNAGTTDGVVLATVAVTAARPFQFGTDVAPVVVRAVLASVAPAASTPAGGVGRQRAQEQAETAACDGVEEEAARRDGLAESSGQGIEAGVIHIGPPGSRADDRDGRVFPHSPGAACVPAFRRGEVIVSAEKARRIRTIT